MQRATSIVRKAAVKIDRVAGIVVLAHEDRQRRRAVLKTVSGMEFLLDLEKATVLGDGDAVRLDDGNLIAVQAASQELLEIRAENPLRLMRVAWHIGNRHTPAEITEDALYIEDDHVLAEMIRGQGCSTTKVTRPFKPERGAYDHGGHDHGSHSHAHDHGAAGHHDHDHHDHGHHGHGDHHAKPNPPHGQPGHVHGPDCNHDHGHDHTHDVLNVGSNHHDHKHDHKHDHDHGHAHDHGHDHGHAPRAKHDH